MKCLNIITFYENAQEVKDYVINTISISDGNIDIALIINSDRCNNIYEIKNYLRSLNINNLKIYNYGENVGYLNAMLKTIKKLKNINLYKYIILSNTDISYKTKDFFKVFMEKKYSNDIGCIAPSIYSLLRQNYSNPLYIQRPTKAKIKFLIKIASWPRLSYIYRFLSILKAKKTKSSKKKSCYIYAPHGCYMIFTKDFIEDILGYEYGVKMYSEESFIGELLRKYHKKCFYDDELELIHKESTVTSKINIKNRALLSKQSLEYILKEFYK